jgi:hypothetical protein
MTGPISTVATRRDNSNAASRRSNLVITQTFTLNGCSHLQPAEQAAEYSLGWSAAEPQEDGVTTHQAREAGGSFLLFAISSSLSQWLSPASAGLRDKS